MDAATLRYVGYRISKEVRDRIDSPRVGGLLCSCGAWWQRFHWKACRADASALELQISPYADITPDSLDTLCEELLEAVRLKLLEASPVIWWNA